MKGSEMLPLCSSTGGLCCFVLLHLARAPSLTLRGPNHPPPPPPRAPRLSVRFYFALGTFAVNCLCFLSSLTSPNISHLLSLYFCSSLLSSSPLSFFIFISLLLSATCPLTSSFPPPLPPSFAALLRPTEAIRTDGLR